MSNQESSGLLQSFSSAVAGLVGKSAPSVVGVGSGRKSGTGVVWDRDGHIVTAGHVLGEDGPFVVTLPDGKEAEASLVGVDRYSDVGVLKVDSTGLTPFTIGQGEPSVGQFVLALSGAFGKEVTATSGIVTGIGRNIRGWWGTVVENAVISDAKLNPGYSGGPLVGADGGLVGLNVAFMSGRGIAIPAGTLKEVAGNLIRDGGLKRGFLGVVVEQIGLPQEYGVERGLLVRAVDPGSPAKAAGIEIGDIVVGLSGNPVSDEHGLRRLLSRDAVGTKMQVKVFRGGKPIELAVTPGEAK
jgi:S1-C subfamily serine protease